MAKKQPEATGSGSGSCPGLCTCSCTCKGVGYLETLPGVFTPCSCTIQKRVIGRLAALSLPADVSYDKTLGYINHDISIKLYTRFVEVLRERRIPKRSMWITGPAKSGKTSILATLAKESLLNGFKVDYVSMEQFSQAIFSKGQGAVMSVAFKPDILLVEVGYEYTSLKIDRMLGSLLYNIVWQRQLKGLVTVLATRLQPSELERRYGGDVLRELLDGRQILTVYTVAPTASSPIQTESL